MPKAIVLAMHGAPPNDFPRAELAELFALHGRLEQAPGPHPESMRNRYDELEAKVRKWPRTAHLNRLPRAVPHTCQR